MYLKTAIKQQQQQKHNFVAKANLGGTEEKLRATV